MGAARRVAAAALVLVAAVSLSVDLEAGKKVKPGDTYKSRTTRIGFHR